MVDEEDRPVTIDEILRRYAEGQRDFRGLEIEGGTQTFDGQVLDDADFSGAFIVASFRGASLRRAKLRANIKTCDFRDADLRDADFSEARLESTLFLGANMTGAIFDGAGLYSYTMEKGEKPDW
jgi:uncharacterized protein YjbI with pentapeptide repeats